MVREPRPWDGAPSRRDEAAGQGPDRRERFRPLRPGAESPWQTRAMCSTAAVPARPGEERVPRPRPEQPRPPRRRGAPARPSARAAASGPRPVWPKGRAAHGRPVCLRAPSQGAADRRDHRGRHRRGSDADRWERAAGRPAVGKARRRIPPTDGASPDASPPRRGPPVGNQPPPRETPPQRKPMKQAGLSALRTVAGIGASPMAQRELSPT